MIFDGKHPLLWLWALVLNLTPLFTWLFLFKNAGLIPIEWRPPIHVKLSLNLETFIFRGISGYIIALPATAIIVLVTIFISNRRAPWFRDQPLPLKPDSIRRRAQSSESWSSGETSASTLVSSEISSDDDDIEKSGVEQVEVQDSMDSLWDRKYIFSIVLIWPMLNLDRLFALERFQCRILDLGAWFSYVLLHIIAPSVTAGYLWLFQAPAVAGCFGLAFGVQNLAGVFTHLLVPTAPPWYHQLYHDAPGNYSIPGYAAGLTRVDVALGTHVHTDGFHMSPIVFGAIPSLHSAFASLCFLFAIRYSWVAGIILAVFVNWQWWATMYLGHHYRIDLLVGTCYAVTAFLLVLPIVRRRERIFTQRLGSNRGGRTGGMRLLKYTRFGWFFSPIRLNGYTKLASLDGEQD